MPDLRDRVEEDRGLLKKLQMIIPGYRGYRKREDLRIADSLLRDEVQKRLLPVETEAKLIRKRLSEDMELDKLNDIKGVVSDLETLRNRIRHAEQEYSGVSADYRILEDELERLYNYDLRLFDWVDTLNKAIKGLSAKAGAEDFDRHVEEVRETIRGMNEAFNMRTETIAGMVVKR